MGHIDLRLLPAAQRWQRVVGLFDAELPTPDTVALTTVQAAQERLDALKGDPHLTYCVWLVVRLASAAQGPDFTAATRQLGLDVRAAASPVSFLAAVVDRVRAELDREPGVGPFGELALAALGSALVQTMGMQTLPLFGDDGDEGDAVARLFRQHGTPTQLATLLARFFGEFLSRVLRFYVDKTLLLQVGPDRPLTSIYQTEVFMTDLTAYAHRIAGATEAFAADWFSRHHWLEEGAILRERVQGFVAYALVKVQRTLGQEQVAA
jgi:hypothetical protein